MRQTQHEDRSEDSGAAPYGGALLTDLYQLTMGYGYWKSSRHNRQSVFHLFFRRAPFGSGYAIAAGLQPALDWLHQFKVTGSDIDYLRTLQGNDAQPLFDDGFFEMLAGAKLDVSVDAIAEGTVVFPHEPMLRISGPLWQCQWIETTLLTIVNFQTLIATKASRVCQAAGDDQVLEFGLRRAQGPDGGLSASRAAFIGGCSATSNVMAGKRFGIPVRGTHAHSWVMSFDDEPQAFETYADAMPNNSVFLVDTYDTIAGVKNAIQVGRRLRTKGSEMVGIRLDSGDLAELSIRARRLLDEAGFPDAVVVASNDLDEHRIAELKSRGAAIAVWGVGTQLVTAADQPALGGVYKLASMEDDRGQMTPRIKLSEDAIKTSNPGTQQVRRFLRNGKIARDVIYDAQIGPPEKTETGEDFIDLLQPVMKNGKIVGPTESITDIRARTQTQLSRLTHLPALRSPLELGSPDLSRQSSNDQKKQGEKHPADNTTGMVVLEPRLLALKERLIGEQRQAIRDRQNGSPESTEGT